MITDNELIYEYQQVLMQKYKRLPPQYFNGSNYNNEHYALIILRYVIEKLLHWSPQEMAFKFDRTYIERFMLKNILQYIHLPPETDPETDYFAYAYKLYPSSISLDLRKLTVLMYNKVQTGVVKKYPKGFFEDDLGRERAVLCLRYVLSQKIEIRDIPSLYKLFSSNGAMPFLRSHRLAIACDYSWENPLDYLHESLPSADKNETLYHYYKLLPTMPEFGPDKKTAG